MSAYERKLRKSLLRVESVPVLLEEERFLNLLNFELDISARQGHRVFNSDEGMTQRDWDALVSNRIRHNIDSWLETGRTREGTETPLDRSLGKAPDVKRVLDDYNANNPPTLVAEGDGLVMTLGPPPYRNLGRIVSGYWGETPSSANDEADALLSSLFMASWRLKLARCRRPTCQRYFMLSKPKSTFKKGTFCKVCTRLRSIESGAIITGERRLEAAKTLYNLAGARFSKEILSNPQWTKSSAIKNRVAQYLTKQIGKSEILRSVYLNGNRKGVTAKWVAHSNNWRAINVAAKKANGPK